MNIKDIAKKAGVSFSTVSKVLNNYPDVGPETKEKVLKLIKENNYIPNSSARKLAQKSSTTIGVIISGFDQIALGDNSALQIIKGILEAAGENQYEIIFYPLTSFRQQQKTYQQLCYEHNLAGAIIFGLQTDDPYYEQADSSDLPCVTIDFTLPGKNYSSVSIDNVEATRKATEFMILNGHRFIAAINGKEKSIVGLERYAGYCQALQDHKIPLSKDYVADAKFSEEIAFKKSLTMLVEHPELTAFVCASDIMAVGVYHAAKKAGRKVGKDLAIIGFDDLPIATFLDPKLSTIRQNFFQFGVNAFNLLTEMLNGNPVEKHVFTKYDLEIRESTFSIFQ